MYVTVITGPDGGIAYGPHPTPSPAVAAATSDAPPITARLCPPELVDRSSAIDDTTIVTLEPAAARYLVAAEGQRPHPDHHHRVVAVVVHPATRRAAVVGPFTYNETQHWWTSRYPLFELLGAQMIVLPFIAPTGYQSAPNTVAEGE
jgi:hypothetical protein